MCKMSFWEICHLLSLAPIKRIFFGVITALALEKCKKECNIL